MFINSSRKHAKESLDSGLDVTAGLFQNLDIS